MEIDEFFARHAVSAWAAAPVDRIRAPPGRHPRDLLHSAKSLVVFGKPMNCEIFSLPAREASKALYALARDVAVVAKELAAALESEGCRSIPVPTFLPMRITDGRLKGVLSLKHCAADAGLGELGMNTLLLNPECGNRLVLAAVATEYAIERRPAYPPRKLCTGCRRCIEACPAHAIGPQGVDQLSCLNISRAVPALLRPVAFRVMASETAAHLIEPFIGALSRLATMHCSACLVACPYFRRGVERD